MVENSKKDGENRTIRKKEQAKAEFYVPKQRTTHIERVSFQRKSVFVRASCAIWFLLFKKLFLFWIGERKHDACLKFRGSLCPSLAQQNINSTTTKRNKPEDRSQTSPSYQQYTSIYVYINIVNRRFEVIF